MSFDDIDHKIMTEYLLTQFSNVDEAKIWLSDLYNEHGQILQGGKYKGRMYSINRLIREISIALGDYVESSFQSKYYWTLRNYYEDNIKMDE